MSTVTCFGVLRCLPAPSACAAENNLEGRVREFWERHGERMIHVLMWLAVYVVYEVVMKYVG